MSVVEEVRTPSPGSCETLSGSAPGTEGKFENAQAKPDHPYRAQVLMTLS